MEVVECPQKAYERVHAWRCEGASVGLTPTMGALHQGHYSLVAWSKQECDRSVATIFVNPTQFGPNEDFSRYPRTLEDDLRGLEALGTDLVFVPATESLYPPGFSTFVEPPEVAKPLEGLFRPGHFRGVTTIVLKLFHIVPASVAYFGQKDYQQLAVIRRMVHDLNIPIRVRDCPTHREPDGLAMSSRNRYLDKSQRRAATCLWRALQTAETLFNQGERQVRQLESAMHAILTRDGADSIDYARVVDAHTLEPIESVENPAVALIAVRIGQTRLIDNLLLTPPDAEPRYG